MPKVSIIIPNYNYRRYLPQRLDSVFSQTFTDYEVIFLDDHSTDGSSAYLEEMARQHHVKAYIANRTNTGNPFIQWQKGIERCEGEYIWIAESDDYCSSRFLESLVPLLEARPDAAYAMCGSDIVDQDGAPLNKNYDIWKQEDGQAFLYPSRTYLSHCLLWRCTAYNASMVVFRKDAYLRTDRQMSALRYSGDWLFWIKMAEQGSVIVLHSRLNCFRRHTTSVTAKVAGNEKQLREKLYICSYMLDRHRFGFYRETLAKGHLYKEITRSHTDKNTRHDMLQRMKKYGVTPRAYIFERAMKGLHALLPFIPIPRHDPPSGIRIR